MATNIDFEIKAGALSFTADPKWLNANEQEVPGAKMDEVTWNSGDPRIEVSGDADLGKITIPDPTLFQPGEQIPVNVTGKDGGNIIMLDAVFTALEVDLPATHAELSVTKDA